MMLFSTLNMYLRDNYPSLDALCEDLGVEREDILKRMSDAGFEYSKEHNKFW